MITSLNYLRLPVFFLLTVVLFSFCQAQPAKNDKPAAGKRLFRDSIPRATGYVNDYENIFTDAEERILDSLIKDFENTTTAQIAIITFDTSMVAADSLDALTLRIANEWGVGQKKKDNGVTIGICKGYRKMRIQNGYGIEKILTNTETQTIIDTAFIPGFKKGNYFEGTLNGLKALMSKLISSLGGLANMQVKEYVPGQTADNIL